jgi:hypothetical protein
MGIKFIAEDHSYHSTDEECIDWVSVTRLIHFFKEPFDTEKMALMCAKGKNPKYAGKTPDEIKGIWKNENKRAVDLGSWYHDQRERDVLSCNTARRSEVDLPIIAPIIENNIKLAPEQRLSEGIYPEHLTYLKSAGVCGQSDRVEIYDGLCNIHDYKTNKEIKLQGFVNKQGKTKKLLPPLSHLDECNYNEYALQLSVYMYIILKHNYNLKPGKIVIEHIEFEVEGMDENGYPVAKRDLKGDPIVKAITPYELPYMRSEVIAMFKWLSNNRNKLPHAN